MCLGISLRSTGDPGEHVGLAQNQQVLTVDGDLGATVLAVEHLVALGHLKRDPLARVLADPAVADRQHLALLGLLLRRIRKDDPGSGRRLLLHGLDDQAIAERLELHRTQPPMARGEGCFWHSPCESAKAHATIPRLLCRLLARAVSRTRRRLAGAA